MPLDRGKFANVCAFYRARGLLNSCEAAEVMAMLEPAYPFASAIGAADSVHLHIKVDDTSRLPRAAILDFGARVESEQEGYVKFPHAGGINLIFSSIHVAVEDRLADTEQRPRPCLDHIGIDLRRETAEVRVLFDATPAAAAALGWTHAAQGGDGSKGVYCCHTEVMAKHWVFPQQHARFTRPLEFAFGALRMHPGKMGCDLRPLDPARAAERPAPA
jgi:hypothetical protein